MKCPKCNKEIQSLKNIQSGTMDYDLSLSFNEKDIHYESGEFQTDNNVNEYWCPLCNAVLFTNEEKAIKFLKGENNE